ncbi:transglutaminase family protein [Luteimonas aquatica]|uniref:transglutaminase family protein n=1 Tax=Luteimonas aquatica TaxID=450364 RepID=UPI001F57EECB|nr:transglutaminase family protein [Luteimonas aquatica]
MWGRRTIDGLLTAWTFALLLSATGAAWAAPPQSDPLAPVRAILAKPEAELDLAQAKLTVDRMIDPKIDMTATLGQLDTLTARIKARFPAGANDAVKMELLLASIYQPGSWNDYRPFSYDLDDPFGKNIRNKLIATYLRTRKGNCVSMPMLVVILGQKLGLNITLATAPTHVLAKFHNPFDNKWVNVEATSGGFKLDSSYQREYGITPLAMKNGIYLRPLSRRDAVGVMAGTLLEFYGQQGQQNRRIAVADLLLQANPKDTFAMLQKGNAYFRMLEQRYITKYRSPAAIPAAQRQDYETLRHNNDLWFSKAEALGWAMPSQA